ncbi:unnamed protein product, partial [Rotaria sp. Silwood1]
PDDFEENDFQRSQPRFSKENFPKNLQLVDLIKELAVHIHLTDQQVKQIRQVCENANVVGERYSQQFSDNLFTDSAPIKI